MLELHDESCLSIKGVYEVTLSSTSVLGTFESIGKVVIAELDNHQYELKAVLHPINPPAYAISNDLYIHAVAKLDSDNKNIICSGNVYVSKGFFSKIIEGEDVLIKLEKTLESTENKYSFSLSPFTLWGFSPGTIRNKGALKHISETVDNASLDEVAYCNNLSIP